jgi:hypothetical protein
MPTLLQSLCTLRTGHIRRAYLITVYVYFMYSSYKTCLPYYSLCVLYVQFISRTGKWGVSFCVLPV